MQRYARILSLLVVVLFLPSTLSAAPREVPRDPTTRVERVVRFVKQILRITARITIPIGNEPPPPEDDPNP